MATPLPKTLGPRTRRGSNHDTGPGGLILALILAALALLITLIWSLCVRVVKTTPGLVLIAAGVVTASVFTRPWLGLALAGLGALIYREQCGRTPYADCFACAGAGHRASRRSRRRGTGARRRGFGGRGSPALRCGLCRGKGVRMRWGRALMNIYRRATYTPPTTPEAAAAAAGAVAAGPVDHTDAMRRGYPATPIEQIPPTPSGGSTGGGTTGGGTTGGGTTGGDSTGGAAAGGNAGGTARADGGR